jgi:hypothetical protein
MEMFKVHSIRRNVYLVDLAFWLSNLTMKHLNAPGSLLEVRSVTLSAETFNQSFSVHAERENCLPITPLPHLLR